MQTQNAPLQAKLLAPSTTKTNFGNIATNRTDYDYDYFFTHYHSSEEMAQFLLKLYDSHHVVGFVEEETFDFVLSSPRLSFT